MEELDAYMGGSWVPVEFNDSHLICPPKPIAAQTPDGAEAEPSETRPLSLRNCDNKLIAGVCAHMLAPAQQKYVVSTANGFVFERQLVDNVIRFLNEIIVKLIARPICFGDLP